MMLMLLLLMLLLLLLDRLGWDEWGGSKVESSVRDSGSGRGEGSWSEGSGLNGNHFLPHLFYSTCPCMTVSQQALRLSLAGTAISSLAGSGALWPPIGIVFLGVLGALVFRLFRVSS
jgi:hypothetical protein